MASRHVVQRSIATLDVAHQHDSVGMRLLEHRAVNRSDIGPVVDMAEEQAKTAQPRHVVDAAQHLEQKRVGDVAHDHAEQRALAAAQRAGEEVGLVAQLLGGRHDPLAGGVPHGHASLAPVEDARHGGNRHAGLLGNVAQRHGRQRVPHRARFPPLDNPDYRSPRLQTSSLIVEPVRDGVQLEPRRR